MDFDLFVTALVEQRQDFATQQVDRRDAATETLAGNHRELAFDHIEPTGPFGRIDELEALRQRERFVRR